MLRSRSADLLLMDAKREAPKQISSVADLSSKDVRESPASVQVITAQAIRASGARDLMDVLSLVPGITFGRDVDDVVSIGIRGNWAEEGKCLFMLDGVPLNENDFGTFDIIQRIPLNNVERIEVISGPGSVIYGGYAALGVIDIVTRQASDREGSTFSFASSATRHGISRNQVCAYGSHRVGQDTQIDYMAALSQGVRFGSVDVLPNGSPISFQDSTQAQSTLFSVRVQHRGVKVSMLLNDHEFMVSDAPYAVRMRDMVVGAEDHVRLSKRADLVARFSYDHQLPWFYVGTTLPQRLGSNTVAQRVQGTVLLTERLSKRFAVRVGAQGYHHTERFFGNTPVNTFSFNNSGNVRMLDGALLAEALVQGGFGDLTMGYRFEHNSLSGEYAAPRLAYTKMIGPFHAKLLASRAFKVPTVQNLNLGPTNGRIVGEYATTKEVEAGLRIGKNTDVTVNVYDTDIQDPIVYVYDAVTLDNYVNRVRSGTQGAEFRLQHSQDGLFIQAFAGLYRVRKDSDLPEVQLTGAHSNAYQGLPASRAGIGASYQLSAKIRLRADVLWQGEKWSYQYTSDPEADMELKRYPEETLVNAGIAWTPPNLVGFEITAGCRNLTDTRCVILSPYDNGLVPIRRSGREFTLSIDYHLPL